jgi:hypothetical protein
MGCNIYKKPFLFDIDYNEASIDLSMLSRLIPPFDAATSGVWMPIIIEPSLSNTTLVDPLIIANNGVTTSFDPLRCIPDTTKNYSEIESDPTVNCDYCAAIAPDSYIKTWKLKDTQGNIKQGIGSEISATCCNGACDTRMKIDDYLPKIPIINQNYLSSFYDFKYLQQFPATNNPGLGFEGFINVAPNQLKSFELSPSLVIDWRLRETISEVIYDEMTSQHINNDQHNKSFNKSFNTSKTCGNFILTQINPNTTGVHPDYPIFSGLIGDSDQSKVTLSLEDLLPSVSGFTNPYGFTRNTYDNIFIHNEKLGSHWKWNYSSGVLCWYRYFDVASSGDNRPIKNVDLYISPGDVFFATNDGPEPLTIAYESQMDIKPCPSGLKLLKNNSVAGIIPSGSKFTYISSNLYPRFIELYTKIDTANRADDRSMTPKQKFDLAALLCTAPQYDGVTLDLYKRNSAYNYIINSYIQISGFNENMNTIPIGSVSNLNFIRNRDDLINTLADKYGSYLWCPPQQTTTIKLKNKIKNQCLVDLEFDMTLEATDTRFTGSSCQPTTDCSDNISRKSFTYNQQFSLGNINFSTRTDTYTRYNANCSSGNITPVQSAKTAGAYLNNSLIKEIVYNSGCYTFQDNYPRIISSSTTNSCSVCLSDSSYKLPNVYSEKICRDYQGDLSWCDEPSARFYNNSEGGDIVGDRPGRSILDGSLYFKRSYPASIFNPHIDRLAFHNQGGIYYVCNPLGAIRGSTVFVENTTSLFSDESGGELSLVFDTKDVGIKIYNLSIEKIRGPAADSYACKGFPIKDSCKCFSLSNITEYPYVCSSSSAITYSNQNKVLYTPGLSTQNSPKLKAYGGYSLNKLAELLGGAQILEDISRIELQIINIQREIINTIDPDFLMELQSRFRGLEEEIENLRNLLSSITTSIPNHPVANSILPTVNSQIDPLNPYGCEKSVTITLNNYAATNWIATLPSYNTIHADIWAEVLEGVNLFRANNFIIDLDSGDFAVTPNLGYQRFTTKVNLNDITIYDQQKKVLINKGVGSSSSINIGLSNPYLEALLGDEFYLYPPSGNFCETNNIFSTRGDEISSVPIRFSRVPRKQILNFSIPSYTALGNLRRGFFHPNSGLSFSSDYNNLTPIVHDSGTHSYYIDYEKDKFRAESSYSNGLVLVGQLNSDIERILTQINNSSDHRKLRLYLKLSDGWYLYDNPNAFGFFNKENLYIGEPFMFEYLSSEDKADIQGPWLPSCPKEPLEFDFVYNYRPTGTSILDYNIDNYPLCIVSSHKDPDNPTVAMIAGSRPYFYISEKENVVISVNNSIESLSEDEQALIDINNRPVVLLTSGDRWKYIGGSKTSLSSYQLTDYNYLFQNFSDLHIDYVLKNKINYVYGTRLSCDQEVTIINKDNPRQKYTSKIIEKSIYCRNTDKSGRILSFNSTNPEQYIKIFTQIKLDRQLKYDNFYIDFSTLYNNFQGLNGVDSLILYRNLNPLLQKELDSFLDNPAFSTKWADLLDFDNKLNTELSNYIYSSSVIHDNYPLSPYNNLFNKIIVNNNNYNSFNYIIKPEGSSDIKVSYNGLVYYTIHQKYNIGSENYLTKKDFRLQNNYLPLMDINFIPAPGVNTQTLRPQLNEAIEQKLANDKLLNGKIVISGLYKNLSPNHEWQSFESPNNTRYFWLNINPNNKLKSALSFNENTYFYSNTLRVDDPPFTLSALQSSTSSSTTGSCLTTSTAPVPQYNNSLTSPLNFNAFNSKIFSTEAFARYPVYCDTDTVGVCDSEKCGINTIGWTTVKADYNIYQEKAKTIGDIPLESIPFMLSYDAGLYNIVGNNGIKYIQRFELEPNNILYPASNCDAAIGPRPAAEKYSVLNPGYQHLLSNSIVSDHTPVVRNTDILANEMLFRLLYGEQQKINLQRIDSSEKPLTLIDLLRYSYPKMEAKDVYKNIPYDLDINADTLNRKINGSINIKGTLAVGKTTSISINSLSITIKIVRVKDKIKVIASISGYDDLESIIYSESNEDTALIVATQELSPANDKEVYNLLSTCKERRQLNISLSSKIVRATLNTQLCDGEEGEVSFPYWKAPDNPGGKTCNAGGLQANIWGPCLPDRVDLGGGIFKEILPEDRNHPGIYFIFNGGCAGTSSIPYNECTNRGVGKTIIPDGCQEVGSRTQSTIDVDGFARGVIRGCHINGGTTNSQYDLAFSNGGPIESMIGATIIDDVAGISTNPRYESSDCGICFELETDSWSGNKIYNKLGRDWPVTSVHTTDACECANYTYGYCRSSDNIDGCACKSLNYEYSDFPYTFEYCRHSITLMGYKRRLAGYLKNPKIITDTPPDYGGQNAPIGERADSGVLKIDEECTWYSCPAAQPATYYVYNKTTTTENLKYEPTCETSLCNISYDNNNLTISLAGGVSKCIANSIRSACPSITITVPDNSFTVVDSINSECDECGVDSNKSAMVDQHPDWDIITETRTCVLGYLIQGNPNKDGPVGIGGTQTIACDICRPCPDANSCNRWTSTHTGQGQCGKSAPESFPWNTCISKGTSGSVLIGGNHRRWYGDTRTSFDGPPTVIGCDIQVLFDLASSGAANGLLNSEWESNMRQAYMNIAVCKNNQNKYDVNDIVEGVVPGSCGELKLNDSIIYPAIKYRATLNDPDIQATTVRVRVAYYTYQYRRPKTIQDILKGVDTSIKCNELSTSCVTSNIKLSSRYKSIDCNAAPSCYNTNVSKCDDDNGCCRVNRIEYD